MSQLSQADRYLIEQIRAGNQDGWYEVVERYQGRLLAFARCYLAEQEAEDMVQETFLGLLKSLNRIDFECWTLETCLFTILRRRMIDAFRRVGREGTLGMCSLESITIQGGSELGSAAIDSRSPTASDFAAQLEMRTIQENKLWHSLNTTIQQLQGERRFRDLQVFEMIFYAQLRNKDIAERIGIDEKQVALIKHRFIKRLTIGLPAESEQVEYQPDESLLTRLWEEHRPSCPKRSTLGKMLLNVLPVEWEEYIRFHVDTLGCKACQANIQDLKSETERRPSRPLSTRIMQSSIGFFRK